MRDFNLFQQKMASNHATGTTQPRHYLQCHSKTKQNFKILKRSSSHKFIEPANAVNKTTNLSIMKPVQMRDFKLFQQKMASNHPTGTT